MQYDILVQGKLFETITTEGGYNYSSVVNLVTDAVAKDSFQVDNEQPLTIQVVPKQ